MVDVAYAVQPRARARHDLLARHAVAPGRYVFCTAHRAGNVDDPGRLAELVALLRALPLPLVLALHPRTRARLQEADLLGPLEGSELVRITPPLGYLETMALVCNAHAVVTDSGGLQKEAYLAGVRCITIRPSTEWVETVEQGWNVLVDLDAQAALSALDAELPDARPELYGDGHAGDRVVNALTLRYG
jgi:UDP-N-acetylglucosamine 2-epimerase (non-hydrolysing)/UDP-GlcNAc3NAcA epimerase